jgi:hypothetical protein
MKCPITHPSSIEALRALELTPRLLEVIKDVLKGTPNPDRDFDIIIHLHEGFTGSKMRNEYGLSIERFRQILQKTMELAMHPRYWK